MSDATTRLHWHNEKMRIVICTATMLNVRKVLMIARTKLSDSRASSPPLAANWSSL